MSALAPRLLSGLTRPARSLVRVPRAALHARPAREELSTLDKAVGLAASFVCLLVPGGWILSHLENYRVKERLSGHSPVTSGPACTSDHELPTFRLQQSSDELIMTT